MSFNPKLIGPVILDQYAMLECAVGIALKLNDNEHITDINYSKQSGYYSATVVVDDQVDTTQVDAVTVDMHLRELIEEELTNE